jgi:hypothetical protein
MKGVWRDDMTDKSSVYNGWNDQWVTTDQAKERKV